MRVSVWKPTDDDRQQILEYASILFRENERKRGGVRGQTITPQDFLDYWVIDATLEYVLTEMTYKDI